MYLYNFHSFQPKSMICGWHTYSNGYPAWTWEYTTAFVSTPQEYPSILQVVWGVGRHFMPQYSFKIGVGVRKLVEKNVLWLERIKWVGIIFYHGDFLPYLPGILSSPPPWSDEKYLDPPKINNFTLMVRIICWVRCYYFLIAPENWFIEFFI